MELTEQQKQERERYRTEWRALGLSTNRADRERAEQAIRGLYREAGYEVFLDKLVFSWHDSPKGCLDEIVEEHARQDKKKFTADEKKELKAQALREIWWGQHEVCWVPHYLYDRDVLNESYSEEASKRLNLWSETAKSCHWWWPYDTHCFVSERPAELHLDPEERFHNNKGPAIAFPDGWCFYAIHGVAVPAKVVEAPESLTPQDIDEAENAEVRRIIMEIVGAERYFNEGDFELVDKSKFGELWRRDMGEDQEPICVARVQDRKPKKDGTVGTYLLGVPPNSLTARHGVALTYPDAGFENEDDYDPTDAS